MTFEFVEYADREMLTISVADRLASQLRVQLQREGRVLMAVPGGTTPGPIFDNLCAAQLDWDRVDIMLSDERWLPETSDRSNTRLLRERLFVGPAAQATLVPMYSNADVPEDALPELAANIAPRLPFGIVVLGMGADMHTASIFPGADRLDDALSGTAPILLAMRAPGAPEPRITVTAHVLNDALNKHIVIFGAEKRAALETARSLDPQNAPIRAVLDRAIVHWAE
jgi:6-phosphogluconolactonase